MTGHDDGVTPAGAMVGYADPTAGEIVYATPAADTTEGEPVAEGD